MEEALLLLVSRYHHYGTLSGTLSFMMMQMSEALITDIPPLLLTTRHLHNVMMCVQYIVLTQTHQLAAVAAVH